MGQLTGESGCPSNLQREVGWTLGQSSSLSGVKPGALLPWLCLTLAAYAATIAVTGGYEVNLAGIRLRSHSWARPALAAAVVAVVWTILARVRVLSAATTAWSLLDSPAASRIVAAVAASWTLAASIAFGTFAAGGADSYGYVSESRLFARLQLTDELPVTADWPWPEARASLTPLGYVPAPASGRIAPTYPPGYPLLMAPLHVLHPAAVYGVVPVLGVLAVWLTYFAGRRHMRDPLAGGVAALLLSASPVMLVQLVQPMSDVPAAAAWLAAFAAALGGTIRSAAAAGACEALAILIRPNLAPLALLIHAAVGLAGPRDQLGRRLLAASLPLAAGLIVLGAVQDVRYGSWRTSGYGSFGELFADANIRPNLERYPRWLTETHHWFIWLWIAAPIWLVIVKRPRPTKISVSVAWLFCAAVIAAYLPYAFFQPQEWTYSRFLLPALPLMLLLGSVIALSAIRKLPTPLRPVAAGIGTVALVWFMIARAHELGVFELRQMERDYPAVGEHLRERLPVNAIFFSAQHSGSIRLYADRPIVRWDRLDPGWLDEAITALRARGYATYLVAAPGELTAFRERYEQKGQSAAQRLTPLVTIGRTAVYELTAGAGR